MIHDATSFLAAVLFGLLWVEGIVLLLRVCRGDDIGFRRLPDDDLG